MANQVTYVLCLNEEAACILSQPLANIDALDNEEIISLIFSVFTQKSVGSDIVFQKSIETLIASESFDYMTYRIKNGVRTHFDDIDSWAIEMEITEEAHDKLYADLCHKLRAFFNSFRTKKWHYKNS